VCLVAREDEEIRAVEARTGLDILADPRFATAGARHDNRDDLADLLREVFYGRSAAEWIERFADGPKILVIPADTAAYHELLNDPLHRAIGRVAELPHPTKGNVREIAKMVRISNAGVPPHRLAPELGADSEKVLEDLGYSGGEITQLRARGVVVQAG
jgi:crotonobetainyl-CoA:carnitine CoA-transferase CaiB-like acyl-CoA transferase